MSETKETLPSLFEHCGTVYSRMLAQAERVPIEGIETLVYRGHLTKLITKEQGLSVPYYTSVMQALKEMNCVRQLRRGGGNALSVWQLNHEPTQALWEEFEAKHGRNRTPASTGKTALLEQQVRSINERLQSVESVIESLTGTES